MEGGFCRLVWLPALICNLVNVVLDMLDSVMATMGADYNSGRATGAQIAQSVGDQMTTAGLALAACGTLLPAAAAAVAVGAPEGNVVTGRPGNSGGSISTGVAY